MTDWAESDCDLCINKNISSKKFPCVECLELDSDCDYFEEEL